MHKISKNDLTSSAVFFDSTQKSLQLQLQFFNKHYHFEQLRKPSICCTKELNKALFYVIAIILEIIVQICAPVLQ
jgi:hypothetical protein